MGPRNEQIDRRGVTVSAAVAIALLCIEATPVSAAVAYVTIQGSQFMYNGHPVQFKGSNYYPRDHMWANMWDGWNWTEITSEAVMLRNLGLNSVRILVPYTAGGWGGANPPASRLNMLEDIVNYMGSKGIRSCVTLFDWETTFPAQGTSREADHLSVVSAIVNRLKSNPNVFAWDVKNEPDHPNNISGYDNWDSAPQKRDQIVSWLHRMCDAVRAIDSHHPVSAGIRWWENVQDVIGFVDIAMWHSYWDNIGTQQIPQVRGYMASNPKPMLVEEFGWPSHPYPCNNGGQLTYAFSESQQRDFYVNQMNAFTANSIGGCIQWMTFDAMAYGTDPDVSFENYFGLWRYDYTLKPAGEYYRDHFPVTPFDDTLPPDRVTDLGAEPGVRKIRLQWVNPPDTDFIGTMIRYSTTAYPSTRTAGTLLCDRPAAPGSADSLEDSPITPGVRRYYSAFTYDLASNYSAAASVSAVPRFAGDLDHDGDVDQTDFGLFQACLTGPGLFPTETTCQDARLDEDVDVDQEDLRIFEACLRGSNVPADPNCAE
jgi:hypothetical protein